MLIKIILIMLVIIIIVSTIYNIIRIKAIRKNRKEKIIFIEKNEYNEIIMTEDNILVRKNNNEEKISLKQIDFNNINSDKIFNYENVTIKIADKEFSLIIENNKISEFEKAIIEITNETNESKTKPPKKGYEKIAGIIEKFAIFIIIGFVGFFIFLMFFINNMINPKDDRTTCSDYSSFIHASENKLMRSHKNVNCNISSSMSGKVKVTCSYYINTFDGYKMETRDFYYECKE